MLSSWQILNLWSTKNPESPLTMSDAGNHVDRAVGVVTWLCSWGFGEDLWAATATGLLPLLLFALPLIAAWMHQLFWVVWLSPSGCAKMETLKRRASAASGALDGGRRHFKLTPKTTKTTKKKDYNLQILQDSSCINYCSLMGSVLLQSEAENSVQLTTLPLFDEHITTVCFTSMSTHINTPAFR